MVGRCRRSLRARLPQQRACMWTPRRPRSGSQEAETQNSSQSEHRHQRRINSTPSQGAGGKRSRSRAACGVVGRQPDRQAGERLLECLRTCSAGEGVPFDCRRPPVMRRQGSSSLRRRKGQQNLFEASFNMTVVPGAPRHAGRTDANRLHSSVVIAGTIFLETRCAAKVSDGTVTP